MKLKEYTAFKHREQAVKVGQYQATPNGRTITRYYIGKYEFTKLQAKRISFALDKLIDRDENCAAES